MATDEYRDSKDGQKYIIREMSDGSTWFMQDFGGGGKAYNWKQASSACPGGWHLPSAIEWRALNEVIKNDGRLMEDFTSSGTSNHWWSSSEYSANYSWLWYVSGGYLGSIYNDKMDSYPVRCVKNKR